MQTEIEIPSLQLRKRSAKINSTETPAGAPEEPAEAAAHTGPALRPVNVLDLEVARFLKLMMTGHKPG